MYVITGASGKVGGAMARALLAQGEAVRAVVRYASKAAALRDAGCELAEAEMMDRAALAAAFAGADGVFILLPPVFDPAPGYPEARAVANAVVAALREARPRKVVSLSTVGADAETDNLLTQHTMLEAALSSVDLPVTVLRPAWFMDNVFWDVAAARDDGVLRSFLQPVDRAIPMIAAQDVGTTAAALIRETWQGFRRVGLAGPSPVSPQDIAASFGRALKTSIRTEIVPRDTWEALFRAQGMKNPTPRMRMIDGFNEGWIDFKDARVEMRRGQTTLDDVILALLKTEASAG